MTVEYFSELKELDDKSEDKYGIFNVSLVKDCNVIGGYSWRYNYYDDVEEKVKLISSYDLRKLRKKVEEKNLRWIITDINRARNAYEHNLVLVSEHEKLKLKNIKERGNVACHTKSKCGVQYVYLNNNNNNVYWTYRDKKHATLTRKSLSELHDAVIDKGYEWIVKDKELYESILDKEKT